MQKAQSRGQDNSINVCNIIGYIYLQLKYFIIELFFILIHCFVINSFYRITKKIEDKGKHIRFIIPTKENPPPEMSSWLLQFQVSLITNINI